MKKIYRWVIFVFCLIFLFLFVFLENINSLPDSHFEKLLGLVNLDIEDRCINNEFGILGAGHAFEEYGISENSLSRFENNFEQKKIPSISVELNKGMSSIDWTSTPISKADSVKICFGDIISNKEKCITLDDINIKLKEEGNYFCAYYKNSIVFCFYIICPKTHSIYVIENTW